VAAGVKARGVIGSSFGSFHFAGLGRRQRLGEQRVEQATSGVGGGGEACLQPVAKRHEQIDSGDDPVLFGHGGAAELELPRCFLR
jgi:hypothetical protein